MYCRPDKQTTDCIYVSKPARPKFKRIFLIPLIVFCWSFLSDIRTKRTPECWGRCALRKKRKKKIKINCFLPYLVTFVVKVAAVSAATPFRYFLYLPSVPFMVSTVVWVVKNLTPFVVSAALYPATSVAILPVV